MEYNVFTIWVVELLASWPSKFSRHRNDPSMSYVVYLVGEMLGLLNGVKDGFMTSSFSFSRLYLNGQMHWVFFTLFLFVI